jgi:signal transduction histidine kinase
MSPEVEARIFEPFFTTKEVGKGSGQGLALAYSYIVTEHQGTLQVETSPGQGAAFIIRLPKGDDEVRVVQEAHDRR